MALSSVSRHMPDRHGVSTKIRTQSTQIANAAAAIWRQALHLAGSDPIRLAWMVITAPLWVMAGIPAPDRPSFRFATVSSSPVADTPAGAWLNQQIGMLARRLWISWVISAALRGMSIGILITMIWALLAMGRNVALPSISFIFALAIVGMMIGLGFGFVTRPTMTRVATMLDRTLGLDQRLTTAYDPSINTNTPQYIRSIQVADAANVLAEVIPDIRSTFTLTIREAIVATLSAIGLVTILLLNTSGNQIGPTQDASIPIFVPSSERFAREQQEAEAQSQAKLDQPTTSETTDTSVDSAANSVKDLQTLGSALAASPRTADAAEQIANGDYQGAAASLKEAASNSATMTQNERNALADQLDDAADKISGENEQLAESARKAADDLRTSEDGGEQALTDLSSEVQATGDKTQEPSGAGALPGTAEASDPQLQQPSNTGSNPSQQQGSSNSNSQQSGGGNESGNASDLESDPGSGMQAQPGIGDDPSEESGQSGQSGDGQSSSSQGADQPGGDQSSETAGSGQQSNSSAANGNPSADAPSDQSSSSGSRSGEDPGSAASKQGDPNDQSSASTGAGTSSGQSPTQDSGAASGQPGSDDQAGSPSDTANQGKAGDPPPGDPNANDASGADSGNPQSGNQTLVLQGTSDDENVGAGNDIGTSSTGSGSGTGAASGSASQGQVGPAGPDSNHVPDEYRDIVKGYFDGEGTTP